MEEKRKIKWNVWAHLCVFVCVLESASSDVCALFFRIQLGDCACVCVCLRAYVWVSENVSYTFILTSSEKIQCQHIE